MCIDFNGCENTGLCQVQTIIKKPFYSHTLTMQRKIYRRGRQQPILHIQQLCKAGGNGNQKNFTRKFSAAAYTTNLWLTGCSTTNKLYCWPCLLFNKEPSSWSSFGFCDLNNFSSSKKKHINTDVHRHACELLKLFGDDIAKIDKEALDIQNKKLDLQRKRHLAALIKNSGGLLPSNLDPIQIDPIHMDSSQMNPGISTQLAMIASPYAPPYLAQWSSSGWVPYQRLSAETQASTSTEEISPKRPLLDLMESSSSTRFEALLDSESPSNAMLEALKVTMSKGIQCNMLKKETKDSGMQTYVPLHERFLPQINHNINDDPCLATVTITCPSDCKNVHVIKCVSKIERENKSKTSHLDVEPETNNKICKPSFKDFVNTNKKLFEWTGIENFEHFNQLVYRYNRLKYSKGPVQCDSKIMILFMKLRLNLPFSLLAILFNVSEPTVKRIFLESLNVCQTIYDPFIKLPHQSEILNTVNLNPKIRIVLDVREIKPTRSKCNVCQFKCYSPYKQCDICKFMLGVTPEGLFSFVSKSYSGRVANNTIFNQSNLILKLEPYSNEIMVDKNIKKICDAHDLGVVNPTFLLSNKSELVKLENNVGMAVARVHVDRAVERLKKFRIFKSQMPNSLNKYSGSILKLVCAVLNISSPGIAQDTCT